MYDLFRKKSCKAVGTLVLTLCLVLTPLSGAARAASDTAMQKLVSWGVVNGYAGGQLYPERTLTRAEFVAMVNRAYGYKGTGETPFTDVPENAWFYDDIGVAYNTGYFGGTSLTTASPNATLTREQTLALLGRNMRLQQIPGEVTEFSDGRSFSGWSRGYARAAYAAGLADGGAFRPQDRITRGEMAELLQRALGTLVNTAGAHTLGSVYGNVTINTPNVTLRDTTIAGDLYITGGLGLGDVTLENVRVLGDIIVAGGGSSTGGSESVVLRNVTADSLLVDSIADRLVSLRAEGNTDVAETILRSEAYVQDRTRSGLGLRNISLESPDEDASFTLSGNLESVVNKTSGSTLSIGAGTLQKMTVDEAAEETTLDLAPNATVKTLNLDAAAKVTGTGDIGALRANTGGSSTEMLPDTISIRSGQTATVAGSEMNTAQAQESSLDPRLLAGYPKLTNLAPTGATAVFSANKAVTVYWALSYALDGAIGESELVDPPKENTRILSSGNVKAAAAETEVTAALSGLTADVRYTLSAVAVDSRGVRSPVKTLSFTTPDNTVPAFNSGYPVVSQLTDSYAQVTVMPNKTCTLYYALFPNGATAPTAVQLRAGAGSLTGSLRSGSMTVTKNTLDFPEFSGLSSGTKHTLYLCLTDGTRTSAVQTLDVTTEENTAPEFNILPVVTETTTSSLTLTTSLNAGGTLYWAAVPAGTAFPQEMNADLAANITDAVQRAERQLQYRLLQITGGSGLCVSNGSESLNANEDTKFTVTSLEAGTRYDLYCVAKDAAGNYSVIREIKNKATAPAPAATIALSDTSRSLAYEGSATLTAAVENLAPPYSVVWESSDPSAVSVDAYGTSVTIANVNTGDSPVIATVTATVIQGSNTVCSAACAVTAEPQPVAPTLTLTPTSLSIARGRNGSITAKVAHLDGSYSVVWESNNADIRVSAFGETATVTGIAAGSATITARVLRNNAVVDGLTATCEVTVTAS